jgi:hypothetical protein
VNIWGSYNDDGLWMAPSGETAQPEPLYRVAPGDTHASAVFHFAGEGFAKWIVGSGDALWLNAQPRPVSDVGVVWMLRAPEAKPFAERFVGTARRECLDRLLIFNRPHLEKVLTEYVAHYNSHRPHRSLDQRSPQQKAEPVPASVVYPCHLRRRDRLGGLIHEYELAA